MSEIIHQLNQLIEEASKLIKFNNELDIEFKRVTEETIKSKSLWKKRIVLKDFSECLMDVDPGLSNRIKIFLRDSKS